MKTDNKQTTIQLLITSLFALTLTACDSQQEATSNKKPVAQAQGPATGILADSAVEGVSYSASSGASGMTDVTGLYKFNHGDSIEFHIGKLNLGKIPGTGLTTPIELAAGDRNKLLNLLVLFQSLDADNNLANGISIPKTAADALDASLDLKADPGTFPSSPALATAREAAGIAGSIKTADEANAHFLSQAVNLLGGHLWVNQDDTSLNFFRFSTDGSGEYLHGIATPDDSCDANRACGSKLVFTAGVEYGTAKATEYDERGFKLVSTPEVDTDLQSGLSHPRPNWRVYTNGNELIISDIVIVQREREQASLFGELFHISKPIELSSDDEVAETTVQEIRYHKMDNSQSIVGAWTMDKDSIKSPVFLFFPDNRYMLVDPVGSATQSTPAACAKPGVELATYAFDAASGTLKLSSFTYNTAGCAGLSEYSGKPITFKIDTGAQNATLSGERLAPITLQRLSN
ncbi:MULTISPECIES: adhesin [unclassified Nitrosomonas]|uniref:adhesin n=1 Tax=unclassified Nitrosomonas TaxID=2609265 RepID=UPI0019364829|nr:MULTISPECIES: adhesin [unclassified Nitrosomonas]MEB2330738.1 adhesin [Nitrosomonas sp.]QOJ08504.1 MAG: adhesin [Nitrosomonas sp. H1_AOB3]HNR09840.1 adhesin [Nitrosomonas europaea]HNS58400.1 adhesin [Nitrosomonas europaea]